MTTNDVLEKLGIKTRTSTMGIPWPMLGAFGAGMLVGVSTALLLAPRSGAELRGELGRRAARFRPWSRSSRSSSDGGLERLSREELYDKASALDIDGRADMSRNELIEAIEAR